ncbi:MULTISPECIES: GspH/FimT family pseudopilin [Pseudomonas]|uniref:GspH/FimT family pseudopilin n=1 Tax=Pseudomonas TaxID=286 RepID=UPI001BEC66A0|nr:MULTISPECIES: GspH/FimT family pseudopilin [Pseudomonas]MBT2341080.1 GspH/FimT family pseudopilin [Pseudomonas fluorescens]MCD4531802.1 GspH/FimT family pseudopilin [Pseudomonas sp. C3-2018]
MHQQGFSLIELLMGLVIAAIVLSWGGSSFRALVESTERVDAARLLASGLRIARSEAITRNRTVAIRGIDNDWGQGWQINLDGDDQALLTQRSSGARVIGNGAMKGSVRFAGHGQALWPSGAFHSGTLHVCGKHDPVSHHQVVLAPSGRVSLRSEVAEQALCEKGLKARSGRAVPWASRR